MKPSGRHPHKALSAATVRATKTPGRYADGNGLYLIVDKSGAKRWVLRTVVARRRRDIGLGSATLVSLAEARDEAAAFRKIARAGGDPLAERNKARRQTPTFEEAARQAHAERKDTWRNPKHAAQWLTTLETYVFPKIGDRLVDTIAPPEIFDVLSAIWLSKPETARRVRQRVKAIFDWSKAAGFRDGDNPVNGVSQGLPKQTKGVTHFNAMPIADIPEFVRQLRASESSEVVKVGLEFLILTATRTNEVQKATWSEIETTTAIWSLPAERMKTQKPHRVPLSEHCLALLDRAKGLGCGSDYIFPGRRPEKPLSNMAFAMAMRRLGRSETVHGFRSTFSDWASEKTSHPREVVELALAHAVKNRVEAAYRRGDLLEKRRALMADWERFILQPAADVILFRPVADR